MEHDEIKMQLANWINTKNIASAIVEALEEEGAPVTLKHQLRQHGVSFANTETTPKLKRKLKAMKKEAT